MYKITYLGDGETTAFTFSFPFFHLADVRVALDGYIQDAQNVSIQPNDDYTGGAVIFSTPPAYDVCIDIFRYVELARLNDYQPTAHINPEDLNTDFNLLWAALTDIRGIDIDLMQWKNTHDKLITMINYTKSLIEDKLSGGGVLGLYNNLVSVLANATPSLINDYGYVTDPAPSENYDDYGIL